MLSKKVKQRRAINRIIRKAMPWRFCMEAYRDHQITLAELQRRSAKHIEDPNVRVAELAGIRQHIEKLRVSKKTITRQQFIDEMKLSARPGSLNGWGFKVWARLILEP